MQFPFHALVGLLFINIILLYSYKIEFVSIIELSSLPFCHVNLHPSAASATRHASRNATTTLLRFSVKFSRQFFLPSCNLLGNIYLDVNNLIILLIEPNHVNKNAVSSSKKMDGVVLESVCSTNRTMWIRTGCHLRRRSGNHVRSCVSMLLHRKFRTS